MEHLKLKVAVYLFLVKEDKILLSRRYNTGWQDGNYGLPAGHLEPNETLIQALFREVKEEIGLELESGSVELVHTMHRMSQYIDFFFVSKYSGMEPKNMEPGKCDELKWFSFNELPSNMVPSVRSAIGNYLNGIVFSEFENEG